MKMISACLLLTLPVMALAAEINCYSGKTRIYHGKVHDISYDDQAVMFIEDKSNHRVLAYAECIILEPSDFKTVYEYSLKH